MKIKAAVHRELNRPLSIEEVDVADPGPYEVLVKTVACGVCHSDLHALHGGIPSPTPAVLGHEPAGIVLQVGSQVRNVAPGDHVIACTSMFCGSCLQCVQGRPHLCLDRGACMRDEGEDPRLSQGADTIHQFADLGGFAEAMLLHYRAVVKIDKDIPLDRAALVGCAVTTGVGAALNTAQVTPGSSVVVFGTGGVGISVIQGARIAGARQIIAVDIRDDKLQNALAFGATDTINSTKVDPVKTIKKMTRGGAEFAFEVVGIPELLEQAFYCLAPHGTAILVGAIPVGQKVSINAGHFFAEKRIIGCMMGSNRFTVDAPRYLDLYRQGRLDLDGMVTRHEPLERISNAFEAMESGEVTRTVLMFD
ncbi:MAG: S-(hydroxymethyl)glutathione dehydrogenase/alcohol dehydrogenase [Gammaproteobacteria bacterium]|jgi:S-(hydroxymethyl)glutathione dehydrogenase/alcohol dehydrogenase